MANEKLICNQICTWDDTSDGCVKPNDRICPMSSAKIDTGGFGQVKMANERRLIEYYPVIKQIQQLHMDAYRHTNIEVSRAYSKAEDILMGAPTVDAVEVVRCKDCKHNKDGFCVGYHAHHDVMPDDFCSYGERRTDG